MRIVRSFFRLAFYLAAGGSLLVGWMKALAGLGISSENLTPALALISIPFMLWTGFVDKTSPPLPPFHAMERGRKSHSTQEGKGC